MLLLLDTFLLAVPAVALTELARPRSAGAWLIACLAFLGALIVLVSETAGRLRYTPGSLTLACAVLGAAGAVLLWRRGVPVAQRALRAEAWRRRRRCLCRWRAWFVMTLLGLWGLVVLYSLAAVIALPPVVPDVLRYHLPMAVGWMQEGQLGPMPLLDYRANYFPHVVEVFNGWCMVLGGTDRLMVLPQVVLSGLAWPLVAYLALRGVGLRRAWAATGALLASMNTPVVMQMRHEMNDVGFYVMFLLALIAALGRTRFFRHSWLVVGVAAGLALGTKSSGPLAVGITLAALVAGWWCARCLRWTAWRPIVLEGAAVAALATLLGGWVYVANLLAYGNPVYPIGLKLGPLTLPSPDSSYAIHYNLWMSDFGQSPAERIVYGMARWPRLFLDLAPFHKADSAASSGYGFMGVACLVGGIAAIAVVLARRRAGALRPLGRRFTLALLALLLLWNVMFLGIVSLVTAPHSLVDARYQLHFPLLFALLLVVGLTGVPRPLRNAGLAVLLVICALTVHDLVYHAGQRGWKAFRETVLRGQGRWYSYEGHTFLVSEDPGALFEKLEDEPAVLIANRGRLFPFYAANPNQRLYPVQVTGPSMRSADKPDIDAGIYQDAVDNYRTWFEMAEAARANPELRPFEVHYWQRDDVRESTVRFFEAMAERYGARYLYCRGRRSPPLDASNRWRVVQEEPGRLPERPRMILYEYLGAQRRDRGEDG